MDRGAWWARDHRVTKSWTQGSNLAARIKEDHVCEPPRRPLCLWVSDRDMFQPRPGKPSLFSKWAKSARLRLRLWEEPFCPLDRGD